MRQNERGEMLVEFLFGLFIFGGVAIACFPLGIVALGLAAFATIFYAVVLNKVQRHQSAHMYDDQEEFIQRQRTSNAGILARSRRDRPWDKRFRKEFICEQPSAWHPRYEDLADAVDRAQQELPIYHERQTSGKWRPTHAPRDYSDKNGG